MKMPQAYTGSLSNPNDYRCFVLDPHITKPTFMTGYKVTPGNRAEIHHELWDLQPAEAFEAEIGDLHGSAAVRGGDEFQVYG